MDGPAGDAASVSTGTDPSQAAVPVRLRRRCPGGLVGLSGGASGS